MDLNASKNLGSRQCWNTLRTLLSACQCLVRCIIALHELVNNKIQNKRLEEEEEAKAEESKKDEEKGKEEEKKEGDKDKEAEAPASAAKKP